MSNAGPAVEARALVKRYGAFTAVAGIDFQIQRGEVFGLLGPNGAGKTTTVRMLCCVAPVTGGEILVHGMNVSAHPREIKALLGVCPQDFNLDPDFSVLDNLLVYSRYFGIPKDEARRRALALLEEFSITSKAGQNIDELSGGQRRRLLLARALINKPKILLLDEPTTGLDPQSRRNIWEEVGRLKAGGTTILLTTHYMDEAQLLCDRLVVVDNGRIIAQGSPAELIQKHLPQGGNLEDVFIKITGRQLRE